MTFVPNRPPWPICWRAWHRPQFPTAIGIFREVEKPTYDDLLMAQIEGARAKNGRGELPRMLNAGTTWLVD